MLSMATTRFELLLCRFPLPRALCDFAPVFTPSSPSPLLSVQPPFRPPLSSSPSFPYCSTFFTGNSDLAPCGKNGGRARDRRKLLHATPPKRSSIQFPVLYESLQCRVSVLRTYPNHHWIKPFLSPSLFLWSNELAGL